MNSASADLGVKQLTDTDKSELSAAVRKETLEDLSLYHRRMHQWAAQGATLTGFTQADMNWLHAQIEQDIYLLCKDYGIDCPQPSPLEWKKGEDEATRAYKCTVNGLIVAVPHVEAVTGRIRERENNK